MEFDTPGWVVNTLLEIGTPLVEILDTYDQVFNKLVIYGSNFIF